MNLVKVRRWFWSQVTDVLSVIFTFCRSQEYKAAYVEMELNRHRKMMYTITKQGNWCRCPKCDAEWFIHGETPPKTLACPYCSSSRVINMPLPKV